MLRKMININRLAIKCLPPFIYKKNDRWDWVLINSTEEYRGVIKEEVIGHKEVNMEEKITIETNQNIVEEIVYM